MVGRQLVNHEIAASEQLVVEDYFDHVLHNHNQNVLHSRELL